MNTYTTHTHSLSFTMARIGGIDPVVEEKYHESESDEQNFVVTPLPGFRQLKSLWNNNHS